MKSYFCLCSPNIQSKIGKHGSAIGCSVLAGVYIFFTSVKGGWVTTFWERVAHLGDRVFSLLYVYLYVLLFPIWL